MHLPSWRRVLLLVALLLALGGSLGLARANLLASRATSPATCSSHPPYRTDLIVISPAATPPSPDTLSLNLPAPILVVPPPCP